MDNTLIVFLTALAVIAVLIWRMSTEQVAGRRWTFSSALNEFDDAVELVRKFAPAADQLVKLGQLDKAERGDYVTELVLGVLPDIDPQLIRAIIEWWVATEKHGQAQ